jgi:transposase
MGEFPRKSDGRRVFTVEFKRGVVQQLLKGEKTLAEVSRELDIQPSVVRQWKRRCEAGATAAVATNEEVVPLSALREAHQRIRELERLLGKKQMEIEILQAAQEVVKKCMVRPRRATAPTLMEGTVCANVSGLAVER